MPSKPCRNCKAFVSTTAKVCPYCGVNDPVGKIKNPLSGRVRTALKIAAGLLVLVWMLYEVLSTDNPYKSPGGGSQNTYQEELPPRVPDSLDAAQARLQSKAIWVVQILRSANKAQVCGLRGHMWATRFIDEVFSSANKEKQKLRSESTNSQNFRCLCQSLARLGNEQHPDQAAFSI